MKKLFVILPAYNEEENISDVVHLWLNEKQGLAELGYELTVLPIDDGSKDNTKSIILDLEKENENVTAIIHEQNKGLGGGVSTGLTYFHDHGSKEDLGLIMDADNSHKPQYVYSMIEKMKNESLDVVIASRYQPGAKTHGVAGYREFLSFGARMYYSMVLGVKNVKDYTCGYRLYSYPIIDKAVEVYGADFVKERGFSCMMELLYKLYCIGAKFGEVPFVLRYDDKLGESKMKVGSTISSSLKTAIKLRRTIKKQI